MIKILSSVKLAVALIALLIITSILATLSPNLDIYSSFWFRGLLIAFTLNLTFCTLKRLPALFKIKKRNPQDITHENINGIEINVPQLEHGEKKLAAYLSDKKFKVQRAQNTDQVKLLAQKGILNLFAPHILHISLIVVLIGAFLGSFGAEGRVLCYVEQQTEVPQEVAQGMKIEVNDFKTLYDQQGAVDNWVTDFNIYNNEQLVKTGVTKVNHPLKYQGVVFYQSSYGYNHLVEISGQQIGSYAIPDGKIFKLGEHYFNISNTEQGALLKKYSGHTVTESKIIQPGEQLSFSDNITLEYIKLYPYTVLKIKKDPGTGVVMLGFLLLTISSTLFWTGRYQEVKVLISCSKKTVTYNVNCKNKTMRAELIDEISQILEEA